MYQFEYVSDLSHVPSEIIRFHTQVIRCSAVNLNYISSPENEALNDTIIGFVSRGGVTNHCHVNHATLFDRLMG